MRSLIRVVALILVSGWSLPLCAADWVRVAYDDAGVDAAQPHLKKSKANWRVPNSEAFDEALRTVVYGPHIWFGYGGINPKAEYKVKLRYLSDVTRTMRIKAGSITVLASMTVEKGKPVEHEIMIPSAALATGTLELVLEAISGGNGGMVSEVEILSTDPKPLGVSTATDPAILAERGETIAQRDVRMQWFREARFGMFIHWGLYARAAGEWNGKLVGSDTDLGEWMMNDARIPIADYAALATKFNPVKYDPEKWVLAAKVAGMKYMVITAKHHEGFAMFQTTATPFNIVDATPYQHDPLQDLAAACRKHGMKLGFYYSQNLDWHHPGGGGNDWDPAHKGNADQYVDQIVMPQIREILKNYGDIAVMWWDIPGGAINQARADRIYKTVLELQPKIIMNNRLGGDYWGDTETPEQFIPATGYPGRDWETCMTMNNTWGFKKHDHNWKSAQTMIRMLCDIVGKGGNYLLNVGPNAEGEIPPECLERLAEVGKWMTVNGAAIYGTSASPFSQGVPWGRVTQKGDMLYLMVFNLPADRALLLPGLTTKVAKVWFLDSTIKAELVAAHDGAGVKVTVPAGVVMNPEATTVIALKLDGNPDVTVTTGHLIWSEK